MTKGYNAYMTNNTTLMANQVFVSGEMMIEARWPNISGQNDLLDGYNPTETRSDHAEQ
jgi:hypothetical protein